MTRKQELLEKLKKSPTDKQASDAVVAFHEQRNDFEGLYESLLEVVESINDATVLHAFHIRIADILQEHLRGTTDEVLAAALKLRLARLLFERGGEQSEALVLIAEAFGTLSGEDIASRAADMLRESGEPRLIMRLLRRKAAAEAGTERYADTCMQLGIVALGAEYTRAAREVFEELAKSESSAAEKARERLRAVEKKEQELRQRVTELEGKLQEASDGERVSVLEELGRTYARLGEGTQATPLLEEVLRSRRSDEAFKALAETYRDEGDWGGLIRLLEGYAQGATPEERKEMLKERIRLLCDRTKDTVGALRAAQELFSSFPGAQDVVLFCANLFAELGEPRGQADLLARARQETKDRDLERHYLEWEAAIRWRRLEELEEAERLYRRIKSIDPRNEPSLQFYEDYYRQQGDFRKLYSVLSNRQALVEDEAKVEVLRSMAEIAVSHLASPDRAIDALKKILTLKPEDAAAFDELAVLLEEGRRWHAVIEHYNARLERLPDDDTAGRLACLRKILDVYSSPEKQPVPEMVVTTQRRILQLDPGNREVLGALSEFYRKAGRWGELVEVLERRVAGEKDVGAVRNLHQEIARILIDHQHQEAPAIPHLEEVVRLDPRDVPSLRLLTRAYRGRGNVERLFETGLMLLPHVSGGETRELLEELATLAMDRLGRTDKGAELLQQLLRQEPSHPWAGRRLWQAYEKVERWDDLATSLRSAIATSPNNADRRELRERLAIVLADHLGEFEEAQRTFSELLEESPANRQAQKYLERILAHRGDFDKLRGLYEKQRNLAGLSRFFDDYLQKETQAERLAAAGIAYLRVLDSDLHDGDKAKETLRTLMERVPDEPELAQEVLNRWPPEAVDVVVAKAWAVKARHEKGRLRREAGLKAASMLERLGRHPDCVAATLDVVMQEIGEGSFESLALLVDRAERASLLTGVLEELDRHRLSMRAAGVRQALAMHLAEVHRSRTRNLEAGVDILRDELSRHPESLDLLDRLGRLCTEQSDWDGLEEVLQARIPLLKDRGAKRDEQFKLARLYELSENREMAASVFRQIRQEFARDAEATEGLLRVLEELGDRTEVALLLEEQAETADLETSVELAVRLTELCRGPLEDPVRAATVLRKLLGRFRGERRFTELLQEMFDADEALEEVIPALEREYRLAGDDVALVQVLIRQSDVARDTPSRVASLGECVSIFWKKLKQPSTAFAMLRRVVSLDASEASVLEELDVLGREAGEEIGLFDIYKGLLGIGKSTFHAEIPVPGALRGGIARKLAGLADQMSDGPVGIQAMQLAWQSSPEDLALSVNLEQRLERAGLHEEMLAVLEQRRNRLEDSGTRAAVYLKGAEVLENRLGRLEEAIDWLEEGAASGQRPEEFFSRLERLYGRKERWAELAELLENRRRRQTGPEALSTSLQLAKVCSEHLGELSRAFGVLRGLYEQYPDRDDVYTALCGLLKDVTSEEFALIASGLVALLERAAETRGDWATLVDVLRVSVSTAPTREAEAHLWWRLALVSHEHLKDVDQAFDALLNSLTFDATADEVVEKARVWARGMGRQADVAEAILSGLGDVSVCTITSALTIVDQLYEEAGQHSEKRVPILERLAELAPDVPDYAQRLDSLLAESGDVERRVQFLERSLNTATGRNLVLQRLALAQLQMEQGNLLEAIDQLQASMPSLSAVEEGDRSSVFGLLESCLEQLEDWYSLAEVLTRQLDWTPDADERKALLYRVATLHEERLSNPDKAIEFYRTLVALDSGEKAAMDSLTRLLSEVGRFRELEDILTNRVHSLEDPQERRAALMDLSRLRAAELRDAEGALDAIEALLETTVLDDEVVGLLASLQEEFPDVDFRVSQVLESGYRAIGDWGKLCEVLVWQVDTHAQDVDCGQRYRELGEIARDQFHDLPMAFGHFGNAFRHEPESQVLYQDLVELAKQTGAIDGLFDLILEVVVLHRQVEGRNALRRKALLLFDGELGDLAKAERLYRDIHEESPDSAWPLEQLTEVYRKLEDWERLAEVLSARSGLAGEPEARILLLYELASVATEQLEDADRGIEAFEEILSLDPCQWTAYRALEGLFEARGDSDSVISTIRREMTQQTEGEERKEVQIRLVLALMGVEQPDVAGAEADSLLRAYPNDEDALNLLFEAMQKWEHPAQDAVARLEGALRHKGDMERLVVLYQLLASRAMTPEARVLWLERMYDARVELAGDAQGAYAALKIMVHSIPEDREKRRALVEQAGEIGELEDVAEFLSSVAESQEVIGSEVGGEIEWELGQLLERHFDAPDEAMAHYARACEAGSREVVRQSRERLLDMYTSRSRHEELISLLETMASESMEADLRREWLSRASEVALDSLGDASRALELVQPLADEFEADEEIQARYEALLHATDRVDELESFLRRRLASGMDAMGEPELRIRLATLLMTRTDRPEEGVEEAVQALVQHGSLPPILTLLEQVLLERAYSDQTMLRVASMVEEFVPEAEHPDLVQEALCLISVLDADETRRWESYRRVAVMLRNKGQWGEALEQLGRALATKPQEFLVLDDIRQLVEAHGLHEAWLALLGSLLEGVNEEEARIQWMAERARLLETLGREEVALQAWRDLLSVDGQNLEALDRLLLANEGKANAEEMVSVLEARISLEADPVTRAALTAKLARLFESMEGKEADARLWWEELLMEPSAREDAIDALVQIYRRSGEYSGLRELLSEALRRGEGGERRLAWLRIVAGLTEEHLEDPAGAVEWYQALAQEDSGPLDGLEGLRRCAALSDDYERLARADEELLGLVDDERQLELHHELAGLYLDRLGLKQEGQVHLQVLLSVRPVLPEAVDMAFAWVEDPDIGMELSLLLEPVYEEEEDWGQLETLYERQLGHLSTLEEKIPILVKSAEMVADVQGDVPKAAERLGELLREAPGNEIVLERLGAMAERMGDIRVYLVRLQDATENAESGEVLVNLCKRIAAIYADNLDDPDNAASWYRRVLEESPANPDAVAALEALYQKARMSDELASFYEELLFDREKEERIPYLLKLGFLKEGALSDGEGALDCYKEVLALVPNHPAALNRIEGLLEHPKLSLAAVEILEPIYRASDMAERLARLLLVKSGEVEGHLDRAQILAEAGALLAKVPGKANEAFDAYLEAIRERSFNPTDVLTPAEELAESLGAWDELVSVLDEVIEAGLHPELKVELQRRVALVYLDKLNVPAKAERHLKAVLEGDPDNRFALNLLLMIFERADKPMERADVLQRLGDLALDPGEKRARYSEAAELAIGEENPGKAAALLVKALRVSTADLALMEKLGSLYRLLESWDELVDLLERQASLQDAEEAIATLLEAAHVAAGVMESPARAAALAQLVLAREPDHIEALLVKRDALELQDNPRELMQVLQRLSTQMSGERMLEILWDMHALAVRQGEDDHAAKILGKIVAADPGSERALDAQIEQYRRRGEGARLVEALLNRAAMVPDAERGVAMQLEAVGILAGDLGDLERACDLLGRVLDQCPDCEEPLLRQADLLGRQKRYAEAVEVLVRLGSLAHRAEDRMSALKRAALLANEKLGDARMAERLAQEALTAGPPDPELLELLSSVLEADGRHQDLVRLLEETLAGAVELGGRFALQKRLGYLYLGPLGQEEKGLSYLERALSEVEDAEIVEDLIRVYRKRGTTLRLVEMLEKKASGLIQRRQMKEVPQLLFETGGLWEDLGNPARALEAFERCVQADGSFLLGVFRLSMLLAKEDDRKADALGYLQTVLLRINELPSQEDRVNVYLILAMLFLEKGEPRRAKTYVTRLLALDKDNEDGKALLQHLAQV